MKPETKEPAVERVRWPVGPKKDEPTDHVMVAALRLPSRLPASRKSASVYKEYPSIRLCGECRRIWRGRGEISFEKFVEGLRWRGIALELADGAVRV